MKRIVANMQRISNMTTKLIGIQFGETFPFYYVAEYPRSGGTWVAHMIADNMQIAFPKRSLFPLTFECVVHNHWSYNPRLKRCAYVVRDGRDVLVSMFFYALRHIWKGEDKAYFTSRFSSLKQVNEQPAGGFCMPTEFVREWFEKPVGSRYSWMKHVEQWAFGRENVYVVRYEDVRAKPLETMTELLRDLTGQEPRSDELEATVEKFSFERQTGRKPGQEDKQAKKRKGLIGDWKNYFSREVGAVFDSYAGDLLVRLGYEQDREWFKRLPRKPLISQSHKP